jgi:E3 ubiquitin-protein ligase listerin
LELCRFGARPAAGFGFGLPTPADTPLQSHVDPLIGQYLKHVTKKDENTKLKALASLATRAKDLDELGAAELVTPWLFVFKRLVMDNNRAVRLAALRVQALIVKGAGRKLAPNLKELIGPWWIAASDEYRGVADVANASFEVCF